MTAACTAIQPPAARAGWRRRSAARGRRPRALIQDCSPSSVGSPPAGQDFFRPRSICTRADRLSDANGRRCFHSVSSSTSSAPVGRLLGGVGELQVRPLRRGVRDRLRVGDDDLGALQRIWAATLSAGESRTSSLSGLNAAPRTAMRRPTIEPSHTSRARSTIRDPAPHVDRVDLAQEGQSLVDAELAGARHERPDVLGQAAAAEAQAGVEELAADPGVVADRVGQLR